MPGERKASGLELNQNAYGDRYNAPLLQLLPIGFIYLGIGAAPARITTI